MTSNWNQQAQQLWQENKQLQAVQHLVGIINKTPRDKRNHLFVQLAYYFFLIKDYLSACAAFDEALKFAPDDEAIIRNYAVCLSRSQQYDKALSLVKKVDAKIIHDSYHYQDFLCSTHKGLGNLTEAQQAGSRSLYLKHKESCEKQAPLALNKITKPSPSQKNIISFSLWGNQPRYLRGALDNLIASQYIYPNWQCRFYLDNSVPSDFINTLKAHGAEIIQEPDNQSLKHKLSWRFKVANDPSVHYFLVRDTDSVVNLREAMAVQDWQNSGKAFHVMRDWWTHTDLILAGMWGGISGLLPDMQQSLSNYQSGFAETPNIDQWFLRDCIWPLICHDSQIHDRYFESHNAQHWPTAHDPNSSEHVGQDLFAVQPEKQVLRLKHWIEKLPCLQLAK